MLAQRAAALAAFDRLRVCIVVEEWDDNTASFLAKFQSAAASLEPDEWIKLEMTCGLESGVESLMAVLADPQASKVCSLHWEFRGWGDVSFIIPLLISSCPELVSLEVRFKYDSALEFVSSVLEHPGSKVKVLEMPKYTEGDLARFFAALGQSQVSAFTVKCCASPEFFQGLCDYLIKDLLVRLKIDMNYKRAPPELMMSLASCTCLAELEISMGRFLQPTAFAHIPKSITKLTFHGYTFVEGFDWSFLADSNVRELNLHGVREVDGNRFGSALAVYVKAKGLDKLRFNRCDFANETLDAVGLEIGQVKRLYSSHLSDAFVKLVALTVGSPNSELRELVLPYEDGTMSSIESQLVPALRHPNCRLTKLGLLAFQAHVKAATIVVSTFRNRRALFLLLQGQQGRKRYCSLRRLPVEMFRMVGKVLL